MRTIIEHASTGISGVDVEESTRKSLAELGWTWPDLGIEQDDLVYLANEVIEAVRRAKRDLPVSPESQFIQDAIDKRYGRRRGSAKGVSASTEEAGQQFVPFSFERLCLEQAILILTQIDSQERNESFTREMKVIVGPETGVYGIMFKGPSDGAGRATFETRLRCNDLNRLQTASALFVSAINPTQGGGVSRTFASPGAAVARKMRQHRPFVSDVRRLEIRSVINERLFKGTVIPITGRLSLLRQVVSRRAAKVLLLLSLSLVVASALLFALAPEHGWWQWCEQMMGRLATGAFGALLVDGAIDYSALRKSLMAGTGVVTHGALIDWARTDQDV
ncbi:MAG TPA: hypothetical protein VN240_09595 [Propylenella sp.]|nr:hypothetical protein [Propylenella sp.]